LAIPILTAYIAAHPDLKAIGTQHGNITAILPKVLQAAGKKPGDIICGGIDLSPATVDAIKNGWISASFDQVLYLQGYYPVEQIFLTKNYLIPGLHIDTGVGTVTPQNVIAPLIERESGSDFTMREPARKDRGDRNAQPVLAYLLLVTGLLLACAT
jgi:simple sugar transport system substrate-binding protein